MDIHLLKTSPKRYAILHTMNLNNLDDIIHYYPYRYDIIKETYPTSLDDHIIIEGLIIGDAKIFFKGKMSRMSFEVVDRFNSTYQVVIFNRHFLKQYLSMNTMITIIGKCKNYTITAQDIKVKPLSECSGIYPVYSLKDGINQKSFLGYVKKAYRLCKGNIVTFVPEQMLIKHHLIHKDTALYNIHFPESIRDIKEALRFLKYEEFLKFQLTMQCMRQQRLEECGVAKVIDYHQLQSFILQLPFTLTDDQKAVSKEIVEDLIKPQMMYRFLQGDVGSGKTVVSCIALYANYLSGYQGALMAPTEILAKQHYHTLCTFFKGFNIKIALLTGSLSQRQKAAIYKELNEGLIDVVVGTHALFQKKVKYLSLGLVITDEQHRFGVNQRKALKEKGHQVDFLVMSATPIPRTLAMAMYGDMDVSTIQSKPRGRQKVITKYLKGSSMKPILKHVEDYLNTGGQCYVICPLVDDSDAIEAKSALKIAEAMRLYFKNRYCVGLLHGQMKDDEKEHVMDLFLKNEVQILVSTTVVEVGVDVKNANMMVVYNAERFGLSQLHQLRGRIGRSDVQAYCYLMSNSSSQEVIERLRYLESSDNGFDISTYDLKTRGPGDFLGEKQSGLPTFLVADVFKDFPILQVAREDAMEIIAQRDQNVAYNELVRKIILNLKDSNEYVD